MRDASIGTRTSIIVFFFFSFIAPGLYNFNIFFVLTTNWVLFYPFRTVPDISILLWLTPDGFTRQGRRRFEEERVKRRTLRAPNLRNKKFC